MHPAAFRLSHFNALLHSLSNRTLIIAQGRVKEGLETHVVALRANGCHGNIMYWRVNGGCVVVATLAARNGPWVKIADEVHIVVGEVAMLVPALDNVMTVGSRMSAAIKLKDCAKIPLEVSSPSTTVEVRE